VIVAENTSSALTSGGEVSVCATGKVVRTEKKIKNGIEHTSVAATIERHEIVKDDPLYREFFGANRESFGPVSSAAL
jgi:hypothetical protein